MGTDYDSEYSEKTNLFGADPSALLGRFWDRLPARGRILDIGVGQGRNALPLAQKGFRVVGIDPSAVSIALTRQAAQDLGMDFYQGSFLDYQAPKASFDAILAFGLIQILAREEIQALFSRTRNWLRAEGLLFITAWQRDDPSYPILRDSWAQIGANSFKNPEGEIRTYLGKDEILDYVTGMRILHHREGWGLKHRHGDGPSEQHAEIKLVAAKI